MRSDWLPRGEVAHVLAALTPPNRLACEVSMATGLRISDVLNMRSARLAQRMSIRELKTGKTRRVTLPVELYERCLSQRGKIYVFEGRTDYRKPRTRAAVYKDLKRAARAFRLPTKLQLSPHSLRKVWSVEQLKRTGGNIGKVRQLLGHSDEAVTLIYCMADELTARKMGVKHDSRRS